MPANASLMAANASLIVSPTTVRARLQGRRCSGKAHPTYYVYLLTYLLTYLLRGEGALDKPILSDITTLTDWGIMLGAIFASSAAGHTTYYLLLLTTHARCHLRLICRRSVRQERRAEWSALPRPASSGRWRFAGRCLDGLFGFVLVWLQHRQPVQWYRVEQHARVGVGGMRTCRHVGRDTLATNIWPGRATAKRPVMLISEMGVTPSCPSPHTAHPFCERVQMNN